MNDVNEILLHQGALLPYWGVYQGPDQLQGGEFDILTVINVLMVFLKLVKFICQVNF